MIGAIRAVAQLGRALRSGRRGRGFKSHQPDADCPTLQIETSDDHGSLALTKTSSCKNKVAGWRVR